jgi:uncharacterized protein YeaO (DUF488 family)
VLVDRLWPRGMRKDSAPWELWLKNASPSGALRQRYHAYPEEYGAFRARYEEELAAPVAAAALAQLVDLVRAGTLGLVTARSAVELSHAPVLAHVVEQGLANWC